MTKRVSFWFLAAVLTLLVSACSGGGGGSGDPGPTATGPVVQTVAWQTGSDGFVQYSTNDTALYATHQYHGNYTIQESMSSVETQVMRVAGSASSGYGIFFCYHDRSNSYGIVITTLGSYLIVKAVNGVSNYYSGGSWSASQPSSWPTSSSLNRGMGIVNTIRVVRTGGGNFDVYFNGSYETSFADSTFADGDSGYGLYVSDATHENFPAVPSDVRFRQIQPALSTAGGVQTVLWQDDGTGFSQFLTNDPSYYGYNFWHFLSPQFTPMSSVEMEVKKMYGYSHEAYGMIFCQQDNNNFYKIGITINGHYIIQKKIAGTYYYYVGGAWSVTNPSSWPSSANLVTGYGTTNRIKVVNAGGGTFNLLFNGAFETSFADSAFTGGFNGYSAGVGPSGSESFPTPEDIRIRLLSAN